MHVISRKRLKIFWERFPESESALTRWFRVMSMTDYANFADLRKTFPSSDKVGNKIVFNIAGNNYRLIAVIHFNRKKVYIRHVFTHAEYDLGDWK